MPVAPPVAVPVSDRTLNRTLWVRQQLVPGARTAALAEPLVMCEHLQGLQAQDTPPPYLSLAARIDHFDPRSLSAALVERRAVRILSMRGTVHVLTTGDALRLRPWVQQSLDRQAASQPGARPAAGLDTGALREAAAAALVDGPLPLSELADRMTRELPDVGTEAIRAAVRARLPLVQVPPRGLWRHSGGVVYELLTTWLGRDEQSVDVSDVVRRYLRAFGPASAADVTKWSGVTRLGPVVAAMRDELREYRDERGKVLFDLHDGVLADPDLDLSPLLLGTYDNLWLSHADRSRIAADESRRAWMGANGGIGAALFVDGMLEGTWRRNGDDIAVTPFRPLTKREQKGVDDEIARIRAFVDLPA